MFPRNQGKHRKLRKYKKAYMVRYKRKQDIQLTWNRYKLYEVTICKYVIAIC